MDRQQTPWPTREDGCNKRMGEMTRDEQRAQWIDAVERFKDKFGITTPSKRSDP